MTQASGKPVTMRGGMRVSVHTAALAQIKKLRAGRLVVGESKYHRLGLASHVCVQRRRSFALGCALPNKLKQEAVDANQTELSHFRSWSSYNNTLN